MPNSLERRLSALETRTNSTEQWALLVYADAEDLEAKQAKTTAPLLVVIPNNGR